MKVKAGDALRNADGSVVFVELDPPAKYFRRKAVLARHCRFFLDGKEISPTIVTEADEEAGTITTLELLDEPTRYRRYKIENGAPVKHFLQGRVQITYKVA